MGVPLNQPKVDHFSIETFGFGDPPFQENPIYYILAPVLKRLCGWWSWRFLFHGGIGPRSPFDRLRWSGDILISKWVLLREKVNRWEYLGIFVVKNHILIYIYIDVILYRYIDIDGGTFT